MKDAQGYLLREAWKAKGNPACLHPDLSEERSFGGVFTGVHLCTTCGAAMQATRFNTEAPRKVI